MTAAPRAEAGFSLIELLAVMAVMAILAALAVPSMMDRVVRDQIVEAAKLAELAKGPVASRWSATGALPNDNAAAGLPNADKIVSNLVSAVAIEAGAIHVTFGNRASAAILGKTLTLRPDVVEGETIVPVAWVCAAASAPLKMTLRGVDRSDVASRYLPMNCRPG